MRFIQGYSEYSIENRDPVDVSAPVLFTSFELMNGKAFKVEPVYSISESPVYQKSSFQVVALVAKFQHYLNFKKVANNTI